MRISSRALRSSPRASPPTSRSRSRQGWRACPSRIATARRRGSTICRSRRSASARRAIDRSGADVILVARTEGLLIEPRALTPAIDKLVAFAAAGADCLYAPGVREKADIAAMVRAVAPKPLNVLMFRPGLSLAELADLGVRRVSVGGALARVAWAAVLHAAELLGAGSFDGLAQQTPAQRLNDMFAGPADRD